MRVTINHFTLVCTLFVANLWTLTANSNESKPVHFAKGASSATLKGSLKGYQTIDYTLYAKAGQTMNVKLKTSNRSNYFNVLPPNSKNVAIFAGSMNGNEWTELLEAGGEYTVSVYLMRNAARRDDTANYTLSVGITGNPKDSRALGSAPASDTKVKGTPYHATGQLPCSMGDAPEGSEQCEFGVIRGKLGNAQVHVTPPGGLKRVLIFEGEKVTTDHGENNAVKANKNNSVWFIEVNDYEHYQIPDAVIIGG